MRQYLYHSVYLHTGGQRLHGHLLGITPGRLELRLWSTGQSVYIPWSRVERITFAPVPPRISAPHPPPPLAGSGAPLSAGSNPHPRPPSTLIGKLFEGNNFNHVLGLLQNPLVQNLFKNFFR